MYTTCISIQLYVHVNNQFELRTCMSLQLHVNNLYEFTVTCKLQV